MRHTFIIAAAVAIGAASLPVHAAPKETVKETAKEKVAAPKEIAPRIAVLPKPCIDALNNRYGKTTSRITLTHEISGMKVYEVHVTADKGETDAILAENGDLIYAGILDFDKNNLPEGVSAVLQAFGKQPDAINKWDRVSYLVDVQIGHKTYRLDIDPVGRLFDLQSSVEVGASDPSKMPVAAEGDVSKLKQRLNTYFGNFQLHDAHVCPDAPGFFYVTLTSGDHKEVTATLNEQHEVAQWTVAVPETELPAAVTAKVHGLFKSAQITKAVRNYQVYYQVEQQMTPTDSAVIRITSLGDVLRIHSTEEDAAPAKAKATVKKPAAARD